MRIFSKVDSRISFIIEMEMTKSNKDSYQQIYQEVLKAYPLDKKSTIQRKVCDLWNNFKEKVKQDSHLPFSKILWRIYEKNICSQNKRLESLRHL